MRADDSKQVLGCPFRAPTRLMPPEEWHIPAEALPRRVGLIVGRLDKVPVR